MAYYTIYTSHSVGYSYIAIYSTHDIFPLKRYVLGSKHCTLYVVYGHPSHPSHNRNPSNNRYVTPAESISHPPTWETNSCFDPDAHYSVSKATGSTIPNFTLFMGANHENSDLYPVIFHYITIMFPVYC